MITANLGIISPIEQIMLQKIEANINIGPKGGNFDTELTLCEDDKISIDVNIEGNVEYHPEYGRSMKYAKIKYLGGYDARECSDLYMTLLESKKIEKFISENIIYDFN